MWRYDRTDVSLFKTPIHLKKEIYSSLLHAALIVYLVVHFNLYTTDEL